MHLQEAEALQYNRRAGVDGSVCAHHGGLDLGHYVDMWQSLSVELVCCRPSRPVTIPGQ